MSTENLSSKQHERKDKIRKIALQSFLEKGYEATNLKDIIKQTGGSFSDIYKVFKNKENLFYDILESQCLIHFKQMSNSIKNVKNKDIESFLLSFGLHYLEIFSQPETIALARIAFSQIYNKKSPLTWFEENQKYLIDNIIIDYFMQYEDKKISQNAEELGKLFCVMLKEKIFLQNVFFSTKKSVMSKKKRKQHVEFVVTVFLNGILSFH